MESNVPNDSLRKYPIPDSVGEEHIAKIWVVPGGPKYDPSEHDMSVYFEVYSTRLQRALLDGGRHICIKTHSDVIRIAQMIHAELPRDNIYHDIASRIPSNDVSGSAQAVDNTIDLCASVLLMTEIGKSQIGLSARTPVRWDGDSLKAALAEYFTPQKTLDVDSPKLEKLFTARNLSRVGGLHIIWTTNLADHLRFIDDSHSVFVFHCASFLQFQAW